MRRILENNAAIIMAISTIMKEKMVKRIWLEGDAESLHISVPQSAGRQGAMPVVLAQYARTVSQPYTAIRYQEENASTFKGIFARRQTHTCLHPSKQK